MPPATQAGKLVRVVGLALEATGCEAGVGERCIIQSERGPVAAEVVGFHDHIITLMPLGPMLGLRPGDAVTRHSGAHLLPATTGLLGRVINGVGEALDGRGPIQWEEAHARGAGLSLLDRTPIAEPLDVGVRAINSLLTVGRGQRMGLFAGSGVGKSVLLGMMSRSTTADVTVLALVGERGREVGDFIRENLGAAGLERTVVVAAPADDAPLLRLKAAELAMAIADRFRAEGHHVLVLMDSLTRYAQAQRELALTIGEPPATKGYPPSVFARLPALVEQAGNGINGHGSVTGFFTVLTEGDDNQDPIADAARAILDGHVVLSRRIAERGQFPAIDVEASISRLMMKLAKQPHAIAAQQVRQWLATHSQNEDLVSVGAYVQGANVELDRALAMKPRIDEFLRQSFDEAANFDASIAALTHLANG